MHNDDQGLELSSDDRSVVPSTAIPGHDNPVYDDIEHFSDSLSENDIASPGYAPTIEAERDVCSDDDLDSTSEDQVPFLGGTGRLLADRTNPIIREARSHRRHTEVDDTESITYRLPTDGGSILNSFFVCLARYTTNHRTWRIPSLVLGSSGCHSPSAVLVIS